MKPTEKPQSANLASALFADALAPLSASRNAAGQQSYFPLQPDAAQESYFETPVAKRLQAGDFEFPGRGTAEGLIDALSATWTAEGEQVLAATAPRLKEIAAALKAEAETSNGEISALCYTMF
jgi:hypothetical protein